MNIRDFDKPLIGILTLSATLVLAATAFAEPPKAGSSSNVHQRAVSSGSKNTTARTTPQPGKVITPQGEVRLTQADALKTIANRPEVKEWKLAVTNAAKKGRAVTAHIEIDRKEGEAYVVHVFEVVPDDAATSHTATFNWYYVNERSGSIRKEF